MAGINGLVLAVFLISAMASGCYGAAVVRPFSDLKNTLIVTASPKEGSALMAGVDTITVTWVLNATSAPDTSTYKTVKAKLCYAPASQVDRPWRKTVLTNLAKDKTCQFVMVTKPFTAASNTTDTYTIQKVIPSAIYFIRAYVYDANGNEMAYGQTTSADKKTNLFTIVGITGRTASIGVASGVFSAFSVLSLVYFFFLEKKKASRATE